jgi:aspartate carbamoyltransferase catalytic subunit
MNLQGEHILSTKQFDKDGLLELFEEAKQMEAVLTGPGYLDLLKGKLMATIFFEPSTRTRFSFESAMLRLGGSVKSNPDMLRNSSIKKQETLWDTGKVLSQMADVIVMRHPEAGTVAEVAKGSDVPVMNAGDGSNEHPTQGLLDLYTIWKTFGKLDGLQVGMMGDLKNSRVIHSECDLLKHFDVDFVFISPKEVAMPGSITEELEAGGAQVLEMETLAEAIGDLDVLSTSRLQEERFDNPEDCEKLRGSFILTPELLAKSKSEMIVLAPLPRVEELPTAIDSDPKCKYFEQVGNGVALRMALLKKVLT